MSVRSRALRFLHGPACRIRIEAHVRVVKLLVPVVGVSGATYPAGTEVSVGGRADAAVDAFVAGDWLPLRWWEYAETNSDAPEQERRIFGPRPTDERGRDFPLR